MKTKGVELIEGGVSTVSGSLAEVGQKTCLVYWGKYGTIHPCFADQETSHFKITSSRSLTLGS
jgi:hypothetical protein